MLIKYFSFIYLLKLTQIILWEMIDFMQNNNAYNKFNCCIKFMNAERVYNQCNYSWSLMPSKLFLQHSTYIKSNRVGRVQKNHYIVG